MNVSAASESYLDAAPAPRRAESPPPPPAAAELISVLRRRKGTVIGAALACVALAALLLSALPSRYRAQAEVLLESRAPRVVDFDEVLPAPAMDAQAVQSEIRLIQSQQLLVRVAAKLRLGEDSEFGAPVGSPPLAAVMAQLRGAAQDWLGWRPGAAPPQDWNADRRAVAALRRRLTVAQQDVSRVVAIAVESGDPGKAALIANAVADQYIVDQLEAKFEASERAARWLDDRLAETAARLEAAEAAAEAQRARNAAEPSGSLPAARRRLAELGAALASLESSAARRDDPDAQARAAALRRSIAGLEEEIAAGARGDVALRQKEREVEALAALQNSVLTRLKETRAQSGLERPDARLIAEAAPPLSPSDPNAGLILAFALAGGLALGGGLAFMRESADGVHHSVEAAERELGIPVLAALPRLRGWRRDPAEEARRRPGSRLAEAARDLRAALLAGTDGPAVIAVVSPGPGEGKSALAAMLAESCARMGRHAVLVDADIRNPAQARRYGLSGAADMLAALEGSASLDDVLWRDPDMPLAVLPCDRAPATRADLLATPAFGVLLDVLRERFDVVVVDTPPLLAVADGRLMAAQADRVVMAARWGETRRSDLRAALRVLEDAGGTVAGLALTATPPRADPRPGRAEAGARYARFSEYFDE